MGCFEDLPEDCIARVISLTSPRDACLAAAVSSKFLSASESDMVWDLFLPRNIQSILAVAVDPIQYSSKKELYFRLCTDPILIVIDDGRRVNPEFLVDPDRMSFRLLLQNSCRAKRCMLSAGELNFESPYYHPSQSQWKWHSAASTFGLSSCREVAYLVDGPLVEFSGKFDSRSLSPNTAYVAYLVFRLCEETVRGFYGFLEEASINKKVGGNIKYRSLSTLNLQLQPLEEPNRMVSRSLFLESQLDWLTCSIPKFGSFMRENTPLFPYSRPDGWSEIEMGRFFNHDNDRAGTEFEIGLTHHNGGLPNTRGLIIQGIEVRPKEQCFTKE